jgi:hypothetical protein
MARRPAYNSKAAKEERQQRREDVLARLAARAERVDDLVHLLRWWLEVQDTIDQFPARAGEPFRRVRGVAESEQDRLRLAAEYGLAGYSFSYAAQAAADLARSWYEDAASCSMTAGVNARALLPEDSGRADS